MLVKADTRAIAYCSHLTGRLLGISFMTLAELERWRSNVDGARRENSIWSST
jgi:hypothetical protein